MAIEFKLKWEGIDRMLNRIEKRGRELEPHVAGALHELAEETMTEAKRLTPVDEGVLRASGHVRPPVTEGETVTVTMGFGGPAGSGEGQTRDVGYAVYVHEDLNAHHTVGQAKFLEVPINRVRSAFGRLVAEKIRARGGA